MELQLIRTAGGAAFVLSSVAGALAAPALAGPAFRAELRSEPSRVTAAAPVTLVITVRDRRGAVVRDLPDVHEKPMHLLAVSADLRDFVHLHPERRADGSYRLEHVFPSATLYRLFVDYTPAGAAQVVDRFLLPVAGPARLPVPLREDPWPEKTVDGMRVTLEGADRLRAGNPVVLGFALADARTGEPPADLEPYLGAFAHFVIVSEDGEDFLHAHPIELDEEPAGAVSHAGGHPAHATHGTRTPSARLGAHTVFPRPGLYKVWAQFQRAGTVITVPWVVRVRA